MSLLFPSKCVLCGRLLDGQEVDFCTACRQDAPNYRRKGGKIPYVAGWTAVWFYEEQARQSLLRYKFHGKTQYAAVYARCLAQALTQAGLCGDWITWVPVSFRRRLRRGYDQSRLLAVAVGRELGLPVVCLLRKARHTPAQSSLGDAAQRRANALGAYVPRTQILGKRILLLDDIITTGATLSECAKVLRIAGAAEVVAGAVAAARNPTKCR